MWRAVGAMLSRVRGHNSKLDLFQRAFFKNSRAPISSTDGQNSRNDEPICGVECCDKSSDPDVQSSQCRTTEVAVQQAQRIAVLESRVQTLLSQNRELQHKTVLLAIGETLGAFRRLLAARKRKRVVARVAGLMSAHGLAPGDILAVASLCRARNRVAHPGGDAPVDLTDADAETVRIYEAVRRVLASFPKRAL